MAISFVIKTIDTNYQMSYYKLTQCVYAAKQESRDEQRKRSKGITRENGMNRREFSEYYGIPYRTVLDWEAEKRELPDYLLRLLKYQAEIESRVKKDKSQGLFF